MLKRALAAMAALTVITLCGLVIFLALATLAHSPVELIDAYCTPGFAVLALLGAVTVLLGVAVVVKEGP